MKPVTHKIVHHYQPTNMSCGYTALSILLSHYNIHKDPMEIASAIAPNGHDFGSLTAEVASWCRSLRLEVTFYSFDMQITDLSWASLPREQTLERLKLVRDVREIPSLGKEMSKRYVDAYIELLNQDAKLIILPYPRSSFLYQLIEKGPVFVNICSKTLYGTGREKYTGTREQVADDVNGKVGTHSVVIYGNDTQGNFLISDPWSGEHVAEPEALICSVMSASIECDSQCFQVAP